MSEKNSRMLRHMRATKAEVNVFKSLTDSQKGRLRKAYKGWVKCVYPNFSACLKGEI